MSLNEADTREKILMLILVFTIGVVIRFFSDIEIKDEPVRINYVSMVNLTSSAYMGTASINPIRL